MNPVNLKDFVLLFQVELSVFSDVSEIAIA
jgi:hypothetical protein